MLERMEVAERINKVIEIRKQMVKSMIDKDKKSYWSLLREQYSLEFENNKIMLSEDDWKIINIHLKDWADETGILKKIDLGY